MRLANLLLAGTGLLSSTTIAAAAAPQLPSILTAPTAAQGNQRCNMYVARIGTMRKAMETSKGTPSVDTTLSAFDHLTQLLVSANLESALYREVAATAPARTAGENCEVRIGSEFNKLTLSSPIYDRLKVIKAPPDAPTQLYLKRVIEAFERSGVGLNAAGRAKAQALSDQVSKLQSQFEANIPKGQTTITATPAELDGLPSDFMDAHKPGADGKIVLRTDYTDYVHFLGRPISIEAYRSKMEKDQ